jgi:Ni,Fe-hydrogenase III large subunit/Ni,Fe-hydrogenase III component G
MLIDEIKIMMDQKIGTENVVSAGNSASYVFIKEGNLPPLIDLAARAELILIGLFCEEGFNDRGGFTLFYVFEKTGASDIVIFVCPLASSKAASIARKFPGASLYEREISDGFGVDFAGSFDGRRLLFHEIYPQGFHPMLKSFSGSPQLDLSAKFGEYPFKKITGEGVYQIPVGPVHAGIIEPGHFRLSVIGEAIFNLEIRMFYKHRGIEKLAEGRSPEECLPIAEAISGDESAANAAGFCMAVESASNIKVPARAQHIRAVYLELERIYSLLGDLAGMVVDVAYPAGASRLFVLREEVLRLNEHLTGSRFLKNTMTIGGTKRDVSKEQIEAAKKYLARFAIDFKRAVDAVLQESTVIDRFATTGVVKKQLISPLNLTGPAARASGSTRDTRIDHPYGIYGKIFNKPITAETGDVLARFNVKTSEVINSVQMLLTVLKNIPEGPCKENSRIGDGYSLSLIESARGQSIHYVHIKEGKVVRYKVRTASFCNWSAIEHAVLGNIVPDFPLINKSLNLSYSGNDL